MRKIAYHKSEFVKRLAESLGVDLWRRIIIDIQHDNAVIVYIEELVDEEKLEFLPSAIREAEINISKGNNESLSVR